MATNAPYYDPDWLEQRYHIDGCTQAEIADECDVSVRTIRRYMKRFDIETRDPVGENHPLYGTERSEDVREKISNALDGREFSEETRQKMAAAKHGTEISEAVREKISESLSGRTLPLETRRRMSEARRGVNRSQEDFDSSVYYGVGWNAARKRVRERDVVCRECGHDGSESTLDVHHLFPVRLFDQHEELSIPQAHVDHNLVLLCRPCHIRAEYGLLDKFTPRTDFSSIELERFKKGESLVSNAFE